MKLRSTERRPRPSQARHAAVQRSVAGAKARREAEEKAGAEAATRPALLTLGCVSLPMPVEAGGEVEGDGARRGAEHGDDDDDAELLLDSHAAALRGIAREEEAAIVQCFRRVPTPTARRALLLAESLGICGRLWDSGLSLARWLCAQQQVALPGLRVLELGSGAGVSGLAAASLGARVVLTDLDEALPLLRLNARANGALCAHPPAVTALAWGDADSARACGEVDLVLASDVVYDPEGYEPLLATLRQLAAPRVLMAHRSRHPDEHRFFHAAAAHFDVRALLGGPFRPLGAPPTDPPIPPEAGEARAESDSPAPVHILLFVPGAKR